MQKLPLTQKVTVLNYLMDSVLGSLFSEDGDPYTIHANDSIESSRRYMIVAHSAVQLLRKVRDEECAPPSPEDQANVEKTFVWQTDRVVPRIDITRVKKPELGPYRDWLENEGEAQNRVLCLFKYIPQSVRNDALWKDRVGKKNRDKGGQITEDHFPTWVRGRDAFFGKHTLVAAFPRGEEQNTEPVAVVDSEWLEGLKGPISREH